MAGTVGGDPTQLRAPERIENDLRAEITHSLSSPLRGMSILADLLAEALDSPEDDRAVLVEISGQISSLAEETIQRLTDFSPSDEF